MNKEKGIRLFSIVFGVIGGVGFFIWGGIFSLLNFLFAFLIVTVNFIYLEAFTRKVIEKDSSKAKVFILLNMLRYPLIGILLFVIINWKNFEKIPFAVGLSAVVAGLFSLLFTGGEEQNGA